MSSKQATHITVTQTICALFLLLFSPLSFAVVVTDAALVADNVMGPVSAIGHVAYTMCYVVGIGLFLGGVHKYFEYRSNPNAYPLSKSVVLLVLGVVIFFLPFVARLSSSGV